MDVFLYGYKITVKGKIGWTYKLFFFEITPGGVKFPDLFPIMSTVNHFNKESQKDKNKEMLPEIYK